MKRKLDRGWRKILRLRRQRRKESIPKEKRRNRKRSSRTDNRSKIENRKKRSQKHQDLLNKTIREKPNWNKARKKFFRNFFALRPYNNLPIVLKIDYPLGLEEDINKFLETAEKFVGLDSREYKFDLTDCTRVWPSAVTLFCSLVQWCQITADKTVPPRLGSTRPKDDKVQNYLNHCGFYEYVQADSKNNIQQTSQDFGHVVKIRREQHKNTAAERHKEIYALIQKKVS